MKIMMRIRISTTPSAVKVRQNDPSAALPVGMHLERTTGGTGVKILVNGANHKLAPMQSQKCLTWIMMSSNGITRLMVVLVLHHRRTCIQYTILASLSTSRKPSALAPAISSETTIVKRLGTQDGAIVAKRKTLGFFLDLWVKLLNYTKACFRLHLAIADPLPACKEALSDTGICLELITESIVAWEAQNRRLEADFYPQYEYDMATVISVVFIRDSPINTQQIAINVVPVEYKLSGSKSEIKQKAKALLKSSTFLCGECDERDRTSNFAHSSLHSVCLQAFYDGGSKSLRQFPEFHHTIPCKALLLVATIVRNVIHVYSMYGHVNTKQMALGDSEKVYRKLTSMLKQVTDDEYHCEKLDDELRSWAVAGMTGVVVDSEPQGIKSDSDWVVELN
ncbi:uncharacterized protein EDB91DRAFT_1256911 [Suillus paluster]|uniref:uncharacterized protein n=1 Tax=Suillus paluster TaxID=48578 RepID=UPI001B8758E6|nr:uncharacterized protein EDB91DRAFT_1256911 [Suillus paluster]KAG1720572.1 hypothetical protein EDB91DRAFT_1256911 [Suillus paluster]